MYNLLRCYYIFNSIYNVKNVKFMLLTTIADSAKMSAYMPSNSDSDSSHSMHINYKIL